MQLQAGLKREFRVKELGVAEYCLGIEFKQETGKVTLSQTRYINELLEKFGMQSCTSNSPSPASPTSKLSDKTGSTSYPRYRELVGSLMYLSVATKPDIAHSVSMLSQYICNKIQN